MMFAEAAYERFRLAWRANRVAWRAHLLTFGELEIPLFKFLVPHRVSLDVGANKGSISYLLLKHSRAVVAFEANPDLARKLRLSLGERARVVDKAVSDKTGTSTFYIPVTEGGALHPNVGSLKQQTQHDCAWRTLEVEVTTIDQENIDDVGFIKIDTEGTELDVIRGAWKTIARCRPTIMVEINDKNTREASELESLMRSLHYSIVDFDQKKIRLASSLAQCANRNVFFMPMTLDGDAAPVASATRLDRSMAAATNEPS